MNLTTKLIKNFWVVVLIVVVILFFLGVGTNLLLKNSISNLTELSEKVDMAMNEEITIPVCQANLFFYKWLKSRSDSDIQEVEKKLKEIETAFPYWKKTTISLIPSAKEDVFAFEEALRGMKEGLFYAEKKEREFLKKIQAIDQRIDLMRAHCEKIMDNIIDPSKERTRTLKTLSYWSDVDMTMNEDIIQNLLKLRIALRGAVSTHNVKSMYEIVKKLDKGVKHWLKLAKKSPQLRKEKDLYLKCIKDINKLLNQIPLLLSQQKEAISKVNENLHKVNVISEKIMSEYVDTAMKRTVTFGRIIFFISGLLFLIGGVMAVVVLVVVKKINQRFLEFVDISVESFSEFEKLNLLIKPRFKMLMPEHPKDFLDRASSSLLKFASILRNTLRSIKKEAEGLFSQEKKLSGISEDLQSSAHKVTSQAEKIVYATEKIKESVDNIANSMDEMSKAIEEISSRTSHTSTIAEHATQETLTAKEVIYRLAETLSKIDEMSNVIVNIAEKTNLLALNATIEAARAGEAGKGFTVVANEVKKLAEQTREKAGHIEEIVKEITENSEKALKAMDAVAEVIDKLSENAKSIAAAIEEQTAVSSEIFSRTETVKEETQHFEKTAEILFKNSEEFIKKAEEVSKISADIKKAIQSFIEEVNKFKV